MIQAPISRNAILFEVFTGRRIVDGTHLDVAVHDGGECDARLWEIAENLHRSELTVLERSEHVAEWVRLTDEKAKAQLAPSGHTGGRADKGIK